MNWHADDDDDLPEMFCPACRGAVTEDTQQCPHCGDWIVPVNRPSGRLKRWMFVLAVVLMILLSLLLVCPISIPVPRPR